MSSVPPESFTPIPVGAPSTVCRKITWHLRLIADLQLASIVRDLTCALKSFYNQNAQQKIIDVGCGDMPFRHLVQMQAAQEKLDYVGFDVKGIGNSFGFNNPEAIAFDGVRLPLPDDSVDLAICTEVLEHHPNPKLLMSDVRRVLKKGGTLILTVPWSARVHFSPYDYRRYTPQELGSFFETYSSRQISARGTDVSAICSKVIVILLRCCQGSARFSVLSMLGALLWAPWIPFAVVFGQLSLRWRLGSEDDPLGYSVIAIK